MSERTVTPEPLSAIGGALKGTYGAEFPDATAEDWDSDASFVMARFQEYGLTLVPAPSADAGGEHRHDDSCFQQPDEDRFAWAERFTKHVLSAPSDPQPYPTIGDCSCVDAKGSNPRGAVHHSQPDPDFRAALTSKRFDIGGYDMDEFFPDPDGQYILWEDVEAALRAGSSEGQQKP
jgi:hypothetical protein